MHPVQKRRLNDLNNGASIPQGETLDALLHELDNLQDAICAGQSLDDLGSSEANQAAMSHIDALLARHSIVRKKIAELKGK